MYVQINLLNQNFTKSVRTLMLEKAFKKHPDFLFDFLSLKVEF